MAASTRRRNQAKEAHWLQVIGQWQDSGRSIRSFCRKGRHSETKFHWWRKALAQRGLLSDAPHDASSSSPAVPFLPLRLMTQSPAAPDRRPEVVPLEILLEGGHRVRVLPGFDPKTLQEVVQILESATC